MYVARDKDGFLYVYMIKPTKGDKRWVLDLSERQADIYPIPRILFPEVKWEDEEPRELVLKPINEE